MFLSSFTLAFIVCGPLSSGAGDGDGGQGRVTLALDLLLRRHAARSLARRRSYILLRDLLCCVVGLRL
jgi:hypothetical protein